PWQGNEMEYLSKWYWAIAIATAPFFIIVIAVTAYRLIFAGVSVTARKEAMEAVQRWLGAVAMVALAPLMVSTLMWIVAIMMEALIGAYNAVAADLGRPISDWGTVSMTGEGIHTGSVLGTAFVRVFLTGIMLYLNVLYLIRKIALTVFFAFTPIAAMIWAINKNTTAATVWLGELVSNAMMPVAHGLVLCAILIFADVKEMGHGTWVQVLIMLWTFIPLSEALRNSLQSIVARFAGFNEAGVAGSGFVAVAGLGSIAGVARVAGATFGGGRGVGVVPPSRGGNLPPGGGMPPARGGPVLPGGQPSVGWSTPAGAAPGWRAGSVDGGSPVGGVASVGGTAPTVYGSPPGGTTPTLYGPDGRPVPPSAPARLGGSPPSGAVPRPHPQGYAPSPAFQRALHASGVARQTAAIGTAALASLALAGVPGGHLAASGLARVAGGIAAIGAMTAHGTGTAVWRKAAPAVAKLPGAETAAARVRGLAADVAASPYAQKAAGYVSTAGSRLLDVGRVVLGPAEGIRVPPRPVYRDGVTSLDAWHYQRQY
ncbi:MAG: hypothetical protein QMC81_10615, partial [Thermoanaerobacterales bacterium]|nr:hypothetical protein [Thermoanaerobacterales bacterium]